MEATTRIIDLTVGELKTIISNEVERRIAGMLSIATEQRKQATEQPLYGIAGIAKALHCSTAKAQSMKSAGLLDGGFQQIGREIIVRSPQALRDIAERSLAQGHKRKRATLKTNN